MQEIVRSPGALPTWSTLISLPCVKSGRSAQLRSAYHRTSPANGRSFRSLTMDVATQSQSPRASTGPQQLHTRTYQACIPCRRRKVRCDLGPVDNPHDPPCVRCRREAKECFFSATRRKRKPADSGEGLEDGELSQYELINGRKRLRDEGDESTLGRRDSFQYAVRPASSSISSQQPLMQGPPRSEPAPRRQSGLPERPGTSDDDDDDDDDEEVQASNHAAALLQRSEVLVDTMLSTCYSKLQNTMET